LERCSQKCSDYQRVSIPPTEEEVEEIVWGEVKYLEGVAPPNPFRED
jgi:hypothetical protein